MTPNEAAAIQLERAMQLFSERDDYVSALTLAGAAEEIFGTQAHLSSLSENVEFIYKLAIKRDPEITKEAIRSRLVLPRNALKHFKPELGGIIPFDLKEEAIAMIDRAVINHIRVLRRYPDEAIFISYEKRKEA